MKLSSLLYQGEVVKAETIESVTAGKVVALNNEGKIENIKLSDTLEKRTFDLATGAEDSDYFGGTAITNDLFTLGLDDADDSYNGKCK